MSTAGPAGPARPGQTWKRHYRPGEFAPMHPLGQRTIPSTLATPYRPALPGRAWRLHFRPGAVHPVHSLQPVPGPELAQGIDTVPVIHMMVM
jgi:hypothetical protein